MFEESRLVVAVALLLISLQVALGMVGAIVVYDRIRAKKPR